MKRRQNFKGHPQDSKATFRILRSSSNRQDDRIHGYPGDRSCIYCHSGGMRNTAHPDSPARVAFRQVDNVDTSRVRARHRSQPAITIMYRAESGECRLNMS